MLQTESAVEERCLLGVRKHTPSTGGKTLCKADGGPRKPKNPALWGAGKLNVSEEFSSPNSGWSAWRLDD